MVFFAKPARPTGRFELVIACFTLGLFRFSENLGSFDTELSIDHGLDAIIGLDNQ